jgi:SOS-response transcriptional repressor LexA
MVPNKFPAQAEQIERVKAILNLSDEALAAEVAVRPETMQKYAAGYQKAGDKLMRIISRLPETRAGANGQHGRSDQPSAQDQLAAVLREGTMDEVRLLRQVVQTLYRQVQARQQPRTTAASPTRGHEERRPVLFDRKPRLLPALGYIPAGLPQGNVDQVADQFVMVPEDECPDAEFALKVQGDSMVDADIHHGDWVLMSTRRSPREGSVVAALIDNETTLKTYACEDGRTPFLRSENRAYPAKLIPLDELQIQGVMVGKLRLDD